MKNRIGKIEDKPYGGGKNHSVQDMVTKYDVISSKRVKPFFVKSACMLFNLFR